MHKARFGSKLSSAPLIGGQFVSEFGNSLLFVTAMWTVITVTHSTLYLGLFGGIEAVAGISGFFSGFIVDRLPPRLLLISSDLFRALICFMLSIAVSGPTHLVRNFIVAVFLLRIGSAFFGPAQARYISSTFESEKLITINGRMQSAISSGRLLGILIGGTLLQLVGFHNIIRLDGLTFLVSVLSVLILKASTASTSPRDEVKGFSSLLMDGFAHIKANQTTRLLIPLVVITGAALTSISILLSGWVSLVLRANAATYSLLNASILVGLTVGGMLTKFTAKLMGGRQFIVFGSVCLAGITIILAMLGSVSIEISLGCLLLIGFISSIVDAHAGTLLQKDVDKAYIGRVFGSLSAFSALLNPLVFAGAGLFARIYSISTVWIVAGAIMATVTFMTGRLLIGPANSSVSLGG